MQTTIKLTQQDIETIILDFYKRQGDVKESVQFYYNCEIYVIVSEKEKNLTITEPQILWSSDNDRNSK